MFLGSSLENLKQFLVSSWMVLLKFVDMRTAYMCVIHNNLLCEGSWTSPVTYLWELRCKMTSDSHDPSRFMSILFDLGLCGLLSRHMTKKAWICQIWMLFPPLYWLSEVLSSDFSGAYAFEVQCLILIILSCLFHSIWRTTRRRLLSVSI